MPFSKENSLILGGLLYTKLTLFIFFLFGMEPGARFVYNVFIGIIGIVIGLIWKFNKRRSEMREGS